VEEALSSAVILPFKVAPDIMTEEADDTVTVGGHGPVVTVASVEVPVPAEFEA
jgi:hypothetical protein